MNPHQEPAGLDHQTAQSSPPFFRRTSSISYSTGAFPTSTRTSSRSRPKWLVAVTLSQQLAAMAGDLDSERAVLLPLQASLHAQLAAVAREYGMRSSQGLTLTAHLGDILPPAVFIEESWAIAWSPIFAPDGQTTPTVSPSATVPHIVLPIAAVLEAGFDNRQNRPRIPLTISPTRKARPPQLSLLQRLGTCHSTRNMSESAGLKEAKDIPSTEPEGVHITETAPKDEGVSSWPSTPPSPERLPSATSEDRLAWPTSERQPRRVVSSGAAVHKHVRYSKETGPLVERSWNVKMRSLAECSEPSPIAEYFRPAQAGNFLSISVAVHTHAPSSKVHGPLVGRDWTVKMRSLAACSAPSPVVGSFETVRATPQRGESLGYPYCLNAIYVAVYPHFQLYPSGQLPITCPQRSHSVPAADVSSSTRLGYPYYLNAIYDVVYPHFQLYPTREMPMTRPQHWPSSVVPVPLVRTRLGYPYSLNAIYPATYPFLDIYPAKETCKLTVPVRHRSAQGRIQVASVGYPASLSDIHPAVYPHLEPYPSISPRMPPLRRSVSPVIALPRRKTSAAVLSPILIRKASGSAHLLNSPSERVDRDASQDVTTFQKKRVPPPLRGGVNKPAAVLQSSGDNHRPGTPRRPSTPFKWSTAQAQPLPSPYLPLPSPSFSIHSSPTSPPVYAS